MNNIIKVLVVSVMLGLLVGVVVDNSVFIIFDYKDVFVLEYVVLLVFIFDSKYIIYECCSNDIMNDCMYISLWQVEVKSGQYCLLIVEYVSVYSLVFFFDGIKLVYLFDCFGL